MLGYNKHDASELQELLIAIAGAKSPMARDRAVLNACLYNARAYHTCIWNARVFGKEEIGAVIDSADSDYLEWEGAIATIEHANMRAIRR